MFIFSFITLVAYIIFKCFANKNKYISGFSSSSSAEIAYQKKMAKYDDLCKINRFGFLTLVFESNGFLHQNPGIYLF